MKIEEAQQDMRYGYLGGATGALVSGLVWLLAGSLGGLFSLKASVLTLFFGGMVIFPLSMVFAKILGRPGAHQKENPLASLALESTVLLFIGLAIAFATLLLSSRYFFPVMLLVIGGRYLVFQTLYGMKLYWVLGALLILSGGVGFFLNPPFYWIALIGGLIEVLFAYPLFSNAKKTQPSVSG